MGMDETKVDDPQPMETNTTADVGQLMEAVNLEAEETQSFAAPKEPTKVKCSFDAGWQKRGTGKSYDSLSGIYKLTKLFTFSPPLPLETPPPAAEYRKQKLTHFV